MLGIKGLAKRGNSVRSVCKKDLKLWYKTDDTQAPLGEELVKDPNFSIGPEVILNGRGDSIDNWYNPNYNTHEAAATISSIGGSIRLQNDREGTNNHWLSKSLVQDVSWSTGETYRLKFKVRANFSDNMLFVRAATSDANGKIIGFQGESDGNYLTVGTEFTEYTFHFTAGANYDKLLFACHNWHTGDDDANADQYIELQDISLVRTNYLGGWVVNSNDTDKWSIQEGNALYKDGSGSGFFKTAYDCLVAGKKYKMSFDISNATADLGIYENGIPSPPSQVALVAYATYVPGTHDVYFTATKTGHIRIYASSNSSADFTISNITLKEITNSVEDYSKQFNNGNLYSGTALDFSNASETAVSLDYWKAKQINANTKGTFAFWFNADDTSEDQVILGTHNTGTNTNANGNERFYIGHVSGKLDLGWGNAMWTDQSSNEFEGIDGTNRPSVENNTWYRVVVVVDGITCKVYLDGEYKFHKTNKHDTNSDGVYETSVDFALSNQGLWIGSQGETNDTFKFDGMIADVQVYDKAWTAADVAYDWENPNKDVFDNDSQTLLTPTIITPILKGDDAYYYGVSSTVNPGWGAQQLEAGAAGPAQTYFNDGNGTIGFYRTNTSGAARFYPPQTQDGYHNRVAVTKNIVHGNTYVIKYEIVDVVPGTDVKIYTGSVNSYQSIPVDIGPQEFKFVFKGVKRSNVPLQIYSGAEGHGIKFKNFTMHRVITEKTSIQPVDAKILYRLNEGNGDRVYNSAPAVSSELLSSTISSAPNLGDELAAVTSASPASGDENDWTLINDTTAEFKASPNNPSYLVNITPALETGKSYAISFTVSNYSGSDTLGFASHGGVSINARLSANGTYTEVITGDGNALRLFGRDTNNATIKISVKEVLVDYNFIGGPILNNTGSNESYLDLTTGESSNNVVKQTVSTVVGDLYVAEFELVQSTDFGGDANVGSASSTAAIAARPSTTSTDDAISVYSSDYGVKRLVFRPTTTSTDIFVRAGSSRRRIQFRNMSVKKVELPSSAIQENWVSNNWVTSQPHIPQFAMSSYSKKLFFQNSQRLVGTSPISIAKNFTVSLWYNPDGIAPNSDPADRRTIFGFVKDLHDNIPYTQTFHSFSIEHWEHSGSTADGDEMYVWTGNGDRHGTGTNGDGGSQETATGPDSDGDGTYSSQLFDTTFTGNKMSHIAVSVDNIGTVKVYQDGIEKVDGIPPWLANAVNGQTHGAITHFVIGSRRDQSASSPLEGIVDEIALFDEKLEEQEIREIFNSGVAKDARKVGESLIIHDPDVATTQSLEGFSDLGTETNVNAPDFSLDPKGLRIKNDELVDSGNSSTPPYNANDGKVKIQTDSNLFTVGDYYKFSYDIVENNDDAVFQYWNGNNYIAVPRTVGSHEVTFSPTNITSNAFFVKVHSQGKSIVVNNMNLRKDCLVGYWRNNGNETWTDLSRNSNNATISGLIDTTHYLADTIRLQEVPYFNKDSFGMPMNRVKTKYFVGDTKSYIETDKGLLNFGSTGDFTIEMWAQFKYFNKGSGWNVLISNGNISSDGGVGISIASDSNQRFGVRLHDGTNKTTKYTPGGLVEGNWYHIAVKRYNNGTTIDIVLDKDSNPTNNITAKDIDTSNPIKIGRDLLSSRYYEGLIDDVRVYDRALSNAEITRNYNAGKFKHRNNSAYWSDEY